ncbi:Uncharacterized protein Rs2_05831 [Raphanus sativus]|nr:Uncharacterized protein Rs2_05831 [Raphanus sativus]
MMPLCEANELAQGQVLSLTLWLARVYMEEYGDDNISLLLTLVISQLSCKPRKSLRFTLTILATWCKRLVKLELSGCEGSFDGIKTMGNVVTTDLLRISSCGKVDPCTGPEKLMRSCRSREFAT